MTLSSERLTTLCDMLAYRRPMGGRTEKAFRDTYVLTLPGAWEDDSGNVHVAIDYPDGRPSRILWSCHTDTVHVENGYQRLHVDTVREMISLPKSERSRKRACLGADDTVGVFLMREMILAKRAGYYIFHYGEERGGIGSSALARVAADVLSANFDFAIALDRAGTADIVTHQSGRRTCSTTFATSLAGQLPGTWLPAHGVYTDTAEYTDLIPECSNVSVGYGRQHTADEFVHYGHVGRLLQALIELDETALVVGDKRAEETAEDALDRAKWATWTTGTREDTRELPWYIRYPARTRRPSQVDDIDAIVYDDDRDVLHESDLHGDDIDTLAADEFYGRFVCDMCDEVKRHCRCDELTEDDRQFLRYLRSR